MRAFSRSALVSLGVLVLAACGGGGGGSSDDFDASDVNQVMEKIGVTVGAVEAVLQRNTPLAAPSADAAAPRLDAGVARVTAKAGDTVDFPLSVNTSALLARLCAKVGAANDRLCALNPVPAAAAANASARALAKAVPAKELGAETLNIKLEVPDDIRAPGSFCVNFSAEDVNGRASNIEPVCVDLVERDAAAPANDQPAAAALPAALAGDWAGACEAEPGSSGSTRQRFRFVAPNAFAQITESWGSADCTGTASVLRVAEGTFTVGATTFNPVIGVHQTAVDFQPAGPGQQACFNALRLANNQLLLGVPATFTLAGQDDARGSCVSAANRPATVAAAAPFLPAAPLNDPPANTPPVAVASASPSPAARGALVTLSAAGSMDAEGPVSFAWSQSGGAPAVSLQGANTASATFVAPDVASNTVLTFQLLVTDGSGASRSATASVQINAAFTVDAGPQQSRQAGDTVTLNGSAQPATGVVSILWTQLSGPTVALSAANTFTPSFVAPDVSSPSELTFQLTVSNGQMASGTTTVLVNPRSAPTSTPPVAAGFATPDPATPGQTVTLDGRGSSDAQGPLSSFQWQQLAGGPSVSLGGASTLVASFVAPTVEQDTLLMFRLTVTDGSGLTDTEVVSVTVRSTSPQCSVTAESGRTVTAGQSGFIPITVSGPGCSLSLNFEGPNAGQVFQSTAGGVNFTAPNVTQPTTYGITVIVLRNGQEVTSARRSVSLLVNPAPAPVCTIAPLQDVTITGGQSGFIAISTTGTSQQGCSFTSGFGQQNAVGNIESGQGGVSFTGNNVSQTATAVLTVTASQNGQVVGTRTATVTVNPAPPPCTVSAESLRTVRPGASGFLPITVTGQSGCSYLINITGGPPSSGQVFQPLTGGIGYSAPSVNQQTTYVINITPTLFQQPVPGGVTTVFVIDPASP